jgi:hypothetical protein
MSGFERMQVAVLSSDLSHKASVVWGNCHMKHHQSHLLLTFETVNATDTVQSKSYPGLSLNWVNANIKKKEGEDLSIAISIHPQLDIFSIVLSAV